MIHTTRLSVAPMMDWTDRHCRMFHRTLSRHALLYTEMITSAALIRGGAEHLLDHDAREGPVVLQLGGSDPAELAAAAALGQAAGYARIDLNCGCPSDRVQSGTFGAIMMQDAPRVADCVAAMVAAVQVPVTVKCRIGVDDQDPARVLPDFIARVADAGAFGVTVHARKAWLAGLSPKENREIPPLDYDLVRDMRARFPGLKMGINGGITSLSEVEGFLAEGFDHAMVGRAAYHQPWAILGDADARLWVDAGLASPAAAARAMLPYIAAHVAAGGRLHQVTRHMLGLFYARPGARAWKRVLSEGAPRPGTGVDLVEDALAAVAQEAERVAVG
jgi:tRNA-dihydrouridine synthase A